MKNIILSLVVALLFAPSMASAANPFIEIRDQLNQLNEQISANTTAINNLRSIQVYVNGVRRGTMMEPRGGNFINATAIRLLLESEYVALLSTAGIGLFEVPISYQSNDCSGQPYLAVPDLNPVAARQGIVMRNNSPVSDTLYYAPAGSAIEVITKESQILGGICDDVPTTSIDAVQVMVNDSTMTGVIPTDFVGEVTIGF